MPTLNIEGRRVKVDDSFLSLTPEQQADTVDEIAASIGITPQAPQQQTQLGADRAMANDEQVQAQTAEGRRAAYDQKPWYAQAAQAADDEARLIASGASLGFADKFSAGMNSMTGDKSYDDQLKIERAATQAARDRAGSAALPSEIAGGVLTGSSLARNGATLAGRFGTAAMPGFAGLTARAGLMAPEGALYGATSALGNDTSVKEGATIGALAGPAGSVLGDAVGAVAGKILPAKTKSNLPDLSQLRKQAKDAYEASENAGVVIKPQGVQSLNAKIQSDLADFGYQPDIQPRAAAVLRELERVSQGNVTLKGMDVTRRIANNARMSQQADERAVGNIIIDNIDNFVTGLKPQDVVMGNARDGVKALTQARSIWTRVAKNEQFSNAIESATLRAASTGSGGNTENAIRQNMRRLIDPTSSSARKNWTVHEKKAIEEIVRGTLGQNSLRLVGKLSPQGNGLMAALGVGGAMLNPTFGAASLTGLGAKALADRGVMNAVNSLDELIRAGGTPQARQTAQAALRTLTRTQREALARIIVNTAVSTDVRKQEPAQ